ncbi:putative Phosphatidylethanolamine-binding protein [Seiridium cardinale]|uniref:Phosphatidylethanolamine-binding protein n=1 Tax=Seiridium cardinale TaxID=138064 RepID=A0ABR2X8N7_9PEZI
MLFESIVVLVAATLSLAATPQGFQPVASTPLMVSFSGIDASGGKLVAKDVSQKQPQLALTSRLTGTSYAVMMIDLDIPTSRPPQTSTLLHWMQTGLVQSSTATALNTTAGAANVFALQMPGAIAAAASYIGPAPPARTPLSHRYTQVLVDTSAASPDSMAVLMQAAQTRQGFNAEQVLTQAGLQNKVVAGNFFVVTNPGPAADSTTGTGTGATTGNSTTGTGRGTGTGTGAGTSTTGEAAKSSTASPFTGAAVLKEANVVLLGIALVGAAFFSV